MDTVELQLLVAAIGDEILGRLRLFGPAGCEACAGCAGQTAEACARAGREIIAAGADRISSCRRAAQFDPAVAGLIDHTLLRPEATRDQVVKLCDEAAAYRFATVCVNPYWVALTAARLAGSPVKVCTVVGFPLGATASEIKAAEAEAAIRVGAQEIDMVINIGALRSGDYDAVKADIQAVVEVSHRAGALVKTILETALLDDNQKAVACTLAKLAGANFVKTSTGFGPAGASVHDVALMRRVVGAEMGVKASGGIRTLEDLRAMVAAGATRIGASASVKIVETTRA